jgi:hypothetical protein
LSKQETTLNKAMGGPETAADRTGWKSLKEMGMDDFGAFWAARELPPSVGILAVVSNAGMAGMS